MQRAIVLLNMKATVTTNTGLISFKRIFLFKGGFLWSLVASIVLVSCDKTSEQVNVTPLFTQMPSDVTHVDFSNDIVENEDFHYYQYIYSYNGGGVASADFNNDGLIDLFFASNLLENKLYLNKGNFEFEDITQNSGIKKKPGFNTGISVIDIDNDGYLDIYVCRAGWFDDDAKLANLLYMNNGDLTFSEKAEEFGLADKNRSISASYFDYDKDGDLDVYINNSPIITGRNQEIREIKEIENSQETIAQKGSDRLYNNDGAGHFIDVSQKAGIVPDLGFGLNSQVADINNDGWLDVYVSNDFDMPDFAYINNGDGTFTDRRDEMFKHLPFYSMGADIADINNDGLYDIFTLDMSPEDYVRSKTTMAMTSTDKFSEMVEKGYHYQYMHNMLQLNNGNGTFSEIANMAGVANTDWSWAPLLADFDLDGYNDLFVTNGVYRDVIDRDANNEILSSIKSKGVKPTNKDLLQYTKMIPQQKLNNYFFKNKGDLTFEDTSLEWAATSPSFSNGAAYADLDNDGDLDLVINNINEKATVLKNNATEVTDRNYLQLQFLGPEKNRNGLDVLVNLLFDDGTKQTRQLINSRGYLSATSNTLHFGLDKNHKVAEIEIIWPDGKSQKLTNVLVNQLIQIQYTDAESSDQLAIKVENPKIFENIALPYRHKDTVFDDYRLQLLLPHKLSQLGPAIAVADVNVDGFDDLYLGGGYSQAGQFLVGQPSGEFKVVEVDDFILDEIHEDIGAVFFDADNDGDQDLYVVSGSYEFALGSPYLQDRLYLNKGSGSFEKCVDCLPEVAASGSVVVPADFDQDGDIDLFVGGRVTPERYPSPPASYLLINSNGKFKIETKDRAPELERIGMVTDALWNDIDIDGDLDLVVTGEWMGIEVFENISGKLTKSEKYPELSDAKGWWNRLHIADIDHDGDQDIVAGNLGLNYKYHATKEKPFHIYTQDFDSNGTDDIVLAKYDDDKQVPVRGKSCMSQQMPFLQDKIGTYNDFANLDLEGIIGDDLKSALHYEANEFRSGIFYNQADGNFSFAPFDNEIQIAPINGILYDDFDGDGTQDLVLAGNNYQSEIETTRADAGTGAFLKGSANGNFTYLSNLQTGFFADKDVRSLVSVKTATGAKILVINNNDQHELYSVLTKNHINNK